MRNERAPERSWEGGWAAVSNSRSLSYNAPALSRFLKQAERGPAANP